MNSFVIVVLALVAAAQANAVYKRLEVEDRIVGGEIAVPNSFPYQVFLELINGNGKFPCGGSLLTTTKILTAAHCVTGINYINVYLGTHDRSKDEATRQIGIVIKAEKHEDYNGTNYLNDIAILTLAWPVTLNEYVQLTTLPTRADVGKTYVGELATVSGWGRSTDANDDFSDVLRFVSSPIVSNEDCSKDFDYVPPSQICADGQLLKAACGGDSGGPLVVGDNRVQVGIVSYGRKDGCEKGFDVAYTRVTEYLDWIATHGDVQIN